MAGFTSKIVESYVAGGVTISDTQNIAATGGFIQIDESIADATTDGEVALVLDVSQVKSFVMTCDTALTVKTNVAATPVDTINLVADVPYIYHTSSYPAFLLTADVTKLFVTNASGGAARFQLSTTYDVTV